MLTFNANPRDGVMGGSACSTCCCETLTLRPGEANIMQLNYAPWSVPIMPPGIQPRFTYEIEVDESNCTPQTIDGFLDPSVTNAALTTTVGTLITSDLSVLLNTAPAGNTFTYSAVPLEGPFYGTYTLTAAGTFTYTPSAGFSGYDVVYIEVTDAQGRTARARILITVGTPTGAVNPRWNAVNPFIDTTKLSYNTQSQTVRFPIFMPPTVRDCAKFKLTIRQPACDCDGNQYHHYMCWDVLTGDC